MFARFLVMVVHINENLYGAEGSTDMVGSQFYLTNEADRLQVVVYDGFSRMAVSLFMIVSAFLLAPMKARLTSWQFYRQRCIRTLPSFFIFMTLYSTLPLLWGRIDVETSLEDVPRIFLNFPSQVERLWFMYPLISLYLFMPVISPWLSKATAGEKCFLIGLFLLSTCMPYLDRCLGEVWEQCFWNKYHALQYFSGYLGHLIPARYICIHLAWNRSKRSVIGIASAVIGTLLTIYPFYVQAIPGVTLVTLEIGTGRAFCTTSCVLFTAGIFLAFTCIGNSKSPQLITEMSKLSYGMYFMHIFRLGLWITVFKHNLVLPTIAAIPCIAVSALIRCHVTTKVTSLIPGSKWIIGRVWDSSAI